MGLVLLLKGKAWFLQGGSSPQAGLGAQGSQKPHRQARKVHEKVPATLAFNPFPTTAARLC